MAADVMSRESFRAREAFLSGRPARVPVRSDILASWRRSVVSGADPDVRELPYDGADERDRDTPLQRAAVPVLDGLAGQIDGSIAALLLADDRARIVARWVGSPDLARVMDGTGSAPGFSLDESACGTNGLGSVLEERRLFHVTGAEHFAARFLRYSCCGAPVRHPVTGRVEGVVTLVCRGEDANPLMAPFVGQAASAVEQRLGAAAHEDERRLLAAFLAHRRRTRRPVLAISEHALIATPAAARTFDRDQIAVLWEQVARAVAAQQPRLVELTTPDDRSIPCRCRPLVGDGAGRGAVVEIGPVEAVGSPRRVPAASDRPEGGGLGVLAGTSRAWRQVLHAAARVGPSALPLLVSGPPGAGKLEVLRALHDAAVARGRFAVVDAALAVADAPGGWLRRLEVTLTGDGEVVAIRHLEALDDRTARAVAALVDQRPADRPPRLVATLATGAEHVPPALAGLVDRFVHRLDVPPLSARPEDIPGIVAALIERHRPGSGRRFSPDTLQALMRADWPGNVRQLETAVLAALHQRGAGDVVFDDLPGDLARRDAAGLTPMQRAERQAITTALRDAEGNKREAAAALGIARSTLYRKLRQFGLDLDRAAY